MDQPNVRLSLPYTNAKRRLWHSGGTTFISSALCSAQLSEIYSYQKDKENLNCFLTEARLTG